MKPAIFIWVVTITVLSSLLFEFKHAVQDGWNRLDHLRRDIAVQQEALQVLQAEWSHLNQPDRLAGLAEKHLDLEPLQPHQILSWTTFATLFPMVSEHSTPNPALSSVPNHGANQLSPEEKDHRRISAVTPMEEIP